MNPKISILTPSFNHEKYIGFFLQSVLGQTFQNFELIIVDDCSWDKNLEEIKKFKDERIKLIRHDYNKGINAALNTAF
ncbi:glycosyltransferase family 2 protein, partial [Helicobacter canadensis]